jgi:hypothetical protein
MSLHDPYNILQLITSTIRIIEIQLTQLGRSSDRRKDEMYFHLSILANKTICTYESYDHNNLQIEVL